MFEYKRIIYLSLFCIILYLIYDENIEKMTEVSNEDKIRELINTIYKADVQAIRNLSDIALKLQGQDGKDITLPGNFRIEGNLNVGGSTAITGDTTIDGATTLKKELTTNESINLKKDLKMVGGQSIRSTGRLHIHPEEMLYLLPKKGTLITKDWGAAGSINMHSNLIVGGNSTITGNSTIKGSTLNNNIRYIQVGNSLDKNNWHHMWAIGEVQVFDETGANVALKKPVKILKGIPHPAYDKNKASDPNSITNGVIRSNDWANYFHGGIRKDRGTKTQTLLEIDLGKEYNISSIYVSARWNKDGWNKDRQKGTHIETFNQDRKRKSLSIWQEEYRKEMNIYF